MKTQILITILFSLILIAQGQDKGNSYKSQNLLKNLNQIRKDNHKSEIKEDSLLSKSLIYLGENDLLENNDKDIIRQALRRNSNYDYKVEIVKIVSDGTDSLNILDQIHKNKKLNDCLNDTLFNKIGIFTDENRANEFYLLLSQHYVDVVSFYLSGPLLDPIRNTVVRPQSFVIEGFLTTNSNFYYRILKDKNPADLRKIEKCRLDSTFFKGLYGFTPPKDKQYFEIETDDDQGTIEILNSSGEIVNLFNGFR